MNKKEYKKHVRGLFPTLVWYFSILLFVLLIWDIAVIQIIIPKCREYQYMQEYVYSTVMESSYEIMEYPSLRKLSNIITFKSDRGKRLNINTYIQSENYLNICGQLQAGEIAISQKMAEKLKVTIGSEIEADYPIYDQPITYKVAKILPYMSDLYDVQNNTDFSMAIVGYDDILYNQVQGKMVYFLDENASSDFIEKEYSYSFRYNVVIEKENFSEIILIIYGIFFAVLFTVCVFASIVSHKEITKETIKYYYEGFDIKLVKDLERKDHLLFWSIPLMSQGFIMALCVFNMKCSPIFAFAVLISLIGIVGVTLIVGGRKYVRANHV